MKREFDHAGRLLSSPSHLLLTLSLSHNTHTHPTYTQTGPEPNGLTKTVTYMSSFLNLVDLAAVLPFYAHFFVHDTMRANLVFLRLLRLLRVARVFKFGRYSEGHNILSDTLAASLPALGIMLFFMLVVTLLFGSLIYYAEEGTFMVTEEYPDGAYFRPSNSGGHEVSPFRSIAIACYWVIMTATTVCVCVCVCAFRSVFFFAVHLLVRVRCCTESIALRSTVPACSPSPSLSLSLLFF